jgi:sensor histidine kinase YesM
MALLMVSSLFATLVFNALIAVVITLMSAWDFQTNLIISNCFGLSFWVWSAIAYWQWQKRCYGAGIFLAAFTLGLLQGTALTMLTFPDVVGVNAAFTGAFFGVLAFMIALLWMRQQQAMLDLKEQQLALQQARISQLQSQIEPHFLFNTLSHVQAYIYTNPAQANDLLNHLTQIMRISLKRTKEDNPLLTVSLSEEISALQHYLAIQSIRLGERLQLIWKIDDTCLSHHVPPLLLQPIVENAIVHGIEPMSRGGQLGILIYCDEQTLHVEISDTGIGMEANAPWGLGLGNLQQRLVFHYGDKASLSATNHPSGGVMVRVSIPLR